MDNPSKFDFSAYISGIHVPLSAGTGEHIHWVVFDRYEMATIAIVQSTVCLEHATSEDLRECEPFPCVLIPYDLEILRALRRQLDQVIAEIEIRQMEKHFVTSRKLDS